MCVKSNETSGRTRRRVLAATAAGSAGFLAGCTGLLAESSEQDDPDEDDGSPATEEPESTATDGPATGTLFADEFEGARIDTDRWIVDRGDDETVDVSDGALYNDSPKRENDGGKLSTVETFAVEGTVRIESRVRLDDPDSWDGTVGELYFQSTENKVELVELDNYNHTELAVNQNGAEMTGRTVEVGPHIGESAWHDYSVTVDLDTATVTSVRRDSERFDVAVDVSDAIGESERFRAGFALGRGCEVSHEFFRLERL
ncbi:hypothetical protein SAMN05216388_100277 [Halorientalis persicus]|uniref:Uncharacterized protein n=1 Tax=Halorientalis persicus TaxID=1367881 RepID=A0A1H8EQ94_9EURY|nr:hypothetical protein SAMN05216388_100277 [Halorientalis persicus]